MRTAGWLVFLLLAAVGAAFAPARVGYTRDFPASIPSLVKVEISQDGHGHFEAHQTATDAAESLDFTASAAVVAEVFKAASKLHQFTTPHLEAPDRVAFTGTKTFTFDQDAVHETQSFNYTTVAAAAQLQQLMDRIAASGNHVLALQRAMRFDRLGTVEELDHIQSDWHAGALAEPQILLPVLRQAAADMALMEGARSRAEALVAAMSGSRVQ